MNVNVYEEWGAYTTGRAILVSCTLTLWDSSTTVKIAHPWSLKPDWLAGSGQLFHQFGWFVLLKIKITWTWCVSLRNACVMHFDSLSCVYDSTSALQYITATVTVTVMVNLFGWIKLATAPPPNLLPLAQNMAPLHGWIKIARAWAWTAFLWAKWCAGL